jgi:hypothetical protein
MLLPLLLSGTSWRARQESVLEISWSKLNAKVSRQRGQKYRRRKNHEKRAIETVAGKPQEHSPTVQNATKLKKT